MVLTRLSSLNHLGIPGEQAVATVLEDLLQPLANQAAIKSIAYVQPWSEDSLYEWPQSNDTRPATAELCSGPTTPFQNHAWETIKLYRGHFGPVANVTFAAKDAVLVHRERHRDLWLVLLEAIVREHDNDAILQKFATAEVFGDGRYAVHEDNQLRENAGGGGPYDWTVIELIVTARRDVVAGLDHPFDDQNNVLLSITPESVLPRIVGAFQAPSPELIPAGRAIDAELMKYLRRFPEHVTEVPDDTFEGVVAEILASHGFSDIQLNVRNRFGEIDIVAFESTKDGARRGYIVECKRYKRTRKVALREAHVVGMKKMLMESEGIQKAMLVTTSDFTKPVRRLYDAAWGLELKSHDEVVEWLQQYKLNRGGLYL